MPGRRSFRFEGGRGVDPCRKGTGAVCRNIGTVFGTVRVTLMNSLTAAELKRRGMAAIEERLRHGPVHLVKRNRAAAVVLSEAQYAELTQAKQGPAHPGMTALQWLLSQPATGSKSKRQLDRELRAERDSWT